MELVTMALATLLDERDVPNPVHGALFSTKERCSPREVFRQAQPTLNQLKSGNAVLTMSSEHVLSQKPKTAGKNVKPELFTHNSLYDLTMAVFPGDPPHFTSDQTTGQATDQTEHDADSREALVGNDGDAIPTRGNEEKDETEEAFVRSPKPSLEPYVGKFESFKLFSTNQCYYIVASDKRNIQYRVLAMDRTLMEHPQAEPRNNNAENMQPAQDPLHRAKPTLRPLYDFLVEDPDPYTQDEIQDMLNMIDHGNRHSCERLDRNQNKGESGGLKLLVEACGIVGFVRFLDCYYLTLITRRAKVGSVGYNDIYTIKGVETFPLKPAERSTGGEHDPLMEPSTMFLNMWNRGKRSVGLGLTNREIAELRYQGLYQEVDFTKNFYFSYTYDLTRSLQDNLLATTSQPFPPPPSKDMYAWNFFLTRELEERTHSLTSYHWVMPIIHGAFVQRKLNEYGRILNLALIARRSRHFAGTRYLKRGVSEEGEVANDVEHEQIVHDESNNVTGGTFSSFLQVRGSIPTFWTQETSVTVPKPPIEINRVDPTYRATQAHFEDLLQRYDSPIIVLDLVKQSEKREREVRVGNEYRRAIDYINTSIDDPKHRIQYCALDYSHISKHRHLDVPTALSEVSTYAVNQTGFFCSNPQWKIIEGGMIMPFGEKDKMAARLLSERHGVPFFSMEQRGVLRTNCIDCLDRTNVAQERAGAQALEQQLVVMGIRSSTKSDPTSPIFNVLIEMYVDIGDHIALQYGGSEAHKKVPAERSETAIHGPIGKHTELLTSIRRYYSNAFTDRFKQDAMNLLLGYYIPYLHTIPLWDLETDYYLHNLRYKSGIGIPYSMRKLKCAFGVEWEEEDEDEEEPPPEKVELASLPSRRAKLAKIVARRDRSELAKEPSKSVTSERGESNKIVRVRRRLKSQKDARSLWWKKALQTYIQQRMLMQFGENPNRFLLPPRFERIYQTDKLAHFDRLSAQASWAKPVRRLHASHAQNKRANGQEEAEPLDYRRVISEQSLKKSRKQSPKSESEQDEDTLLDFYKEHGYENTRAPSMKKFIAHASRNERRSSNEWNANGERQTRPFLGRIRDTRNPCEEYLKYTSPIADYSFQSVNPDKVKEFTKCLHETTMHSDDVEGIRRLAESAHIERTLSYGPYRGLDQTKAAVDITTVIEEQFNGHQEQTRNGDKFGMHHVDLELKSRGYEATGVKEAMARRVEHSKQAQALYAEVVNSTNSACRRSDLTTPASLELYSSFFEDSTPLSALDMNYITGERPKAKLPARTAMKENSGPTYDKKHSGQFVAKAAKLGIAIQAYEDMEKAKSPPLFTYNRDGDVPTDFEQINEDLFARKDNKFIVFNGSGMDAWRGGSQPITKVPAFSADHLSKHSRECKSRVLYK